MDTTVAKKMDAWRTYMRDERHITDEVAKAAGLKIKNFKGTESLVIPVRDVSGTTLFNKYRRAPWSEDGPKYLYDKGAHCALFGIETMKDIKSPARIVLTEGELDALALRSLGLIAVSSTGGAGTFLPEWKKVFEKNNHIPTICYDNDEAGVHGAIRVATLMPGAKIAFLPRKVNGKPIKDITDYIHTQKTPELAQAGLREIFSRSRAYDLTSSNDDDDRLKSLLVFAETIKIAANKMANTPDEDSWHLDIAYAWAREEIDKERQRMFHTSHERKLDGDEVGRARSYPIRNLVKVNRIGFAKCVYHDEKTGSMKCYQDNHAYSYCCGKYSDSIAIAMELWQLPFKEAVAKLNTL